MLNDRLDRPEIKNYKFVQKMCGVTVVVCRDRTVAESVARMFQDALNARGPDQTGCLIKECCGLFVVFVASVLWIRGENLAKQPMETNGGVLAWNGELFNAEALSEGSDTLLLASWMHKNAEEALLRCDGPFAVTFLDEIRRKLLFARNRFGQRSLLIALPCAALPGECITHEPDHAIGEGPFRLENFDDCVVISSTVPPSLQAKFAWKEVPVSGVFELSFCGNDELHLRLIRRYNPLPAARLMDVDETGARQGVLRLLQQSVYKRTVTLGQSCHHVRLLFSGGVDCLLLAVYLHRSLPVSTELVLRNVAFGPDFNQAFDRIQAKHAVSELQRLFPERRWILDEVDVSEETLSEVLEKVKHLTFPQSSVMDVTIGSVLWFAFGGSDSAKVVFSGIGADELFAGYARHKSRFNRAEKGFNKSSFLFSS